MHATRVLHYITGPCTGTLLSLQLAYFLGTMEAAMPHAPREAFDAVRRAVAELLSTMYPRVPASVTHSRVRAGKRVRKDNARAAPLVLNARDDANELLGTIRCVRNPCACEDHAHVPACLLLLRAVCVTFCVASFVSCGFILVFVC